jgi:uridine kinase
MALIVPNATATGSSNKYSNINQAEPDSVDFEALGNTLNYIRSGGGVTVADGNTVNVAAGVAIINGVPYSFAADNFLSTQATQTRFDLVVVRLAGSTAALTVVAGV